MGFAVEEALDELYCAAPGEFTRVRTRLAAAAKKSGDADAPCRIGDSRKPTTAAWVVNTLVIGGTARSALTRPPRCGPRSAKLPTAPRRT
ncbi:hypothetical protein ACTWP6_18565 [Mycobacterium sp. 4D054]|uniref:hypothetical protein n=1 Tax=Mycobacterium sp. 4D054 TaxID=3457440 RepID=UPI003FD08850